MIRQRQNDGNGRPIVFIFYGYETLRKLKKVLGQFYSEAALVRKISTLAQRVGLGNLHQGNRKSNRTLTWAQD